MLTEATVDRTPAGWWAHVRYGGSMEFYGPYRWRWVARLVARRNAVTP